METSDVVRRVSQLAASLLPMAERLPAFAQRRGRQLPTMGHLSVMSCAPLLSLPTGKPLSSVTDRIEADRGRTHACLHIGKKAGTMKANTYRTFSMTQIFLRHLLCIKAFIFHNNPLR